MVMVLCGPNETQDQRPLAKTSFGLFFLLSNFDLLLFMPTSGWLHRLVRPLAIASYKVRCDKTSVCSALSRHQGLDR